MKTKILIAAAAMTAALGLSAQNGAELPFQKWALTPPMGWNSWDCYGPTVVESEVKANADYMALNLKDKGWEYVVVDIRWFVENDKAGGYNQTDAGSQPFPVGRWRRRFQGACRLCAFEGAEIRHSPHARYSERGCGCKIACTRNGGHNMRHDRQQRLDLHMAARQHEG